MKDMKYFACGEHGGISGRPHYHLILIGYMPDVFNVNDVYIAGYEDGKPKYASRTIEKLWPYGFNTVGSVTPKSLFYTTGYVIKDGEGFRLMSKKIGVKYLNENKDLLWKRILNHELMIGSYLFKKLCEELGDTDEHSPFKDRYYLANMNRTQKEFEEESGLNWQSDKKGQEWIEEWLNRELDKREFRKMLCEAREDITRRRKI